MSKVLEEYTMARLWGNVNEEEYENEMVSLDVERTAPDEVAIHLFIDGQGSMCSYYLNRDTALEIATKLLLEARVGTP